MALLTCPVRIVLSWLSCPDFSFLAVTIFASKSCSSITFLADIVTALRIFSVQERGSNQQIIFNAIAFGMPISARNFFGMLIAAKGITIYFCHTARRIFSPGCQFDFLCQFFYAQMKYLFIIQEIFSRCI
jgi:hypothetical protein